MALFQRFFKGADRDKSAKDRSPEDARPAPEPLLTEEIRALIQELRQLRDTLGTLTTTGREGAVAVPAQPRVRRPGRQRAGADAAPGSPPQQVGRKPQQPRAAPEDAPTGPLVDYLRGRGVVVYEGQDELARNEAFEHLARHLGQHFALLAPFYDKLKRAVATGHGTRIDIEGMSEPERSAAVQVGTLLHRHGLLKDFYYHRTPKKQLRIIPTQDGETAQFLTGGWLEMFVAWLLARRLKARLSPAKFQILYNVKGSLPDGREFEADIMAWVEGRLLWMECKTGNWQDYSARFRGLVSVFGCDRHSCALLLLRAPDTGTRARVTDMHEMSLISLDEVSRFVNRFLGAGEDEEAEARAPEGAAAPGERGELDSDRTAPLPLGVIPPLREEEIPLEHVEPARKLGRVELDKARGAGEEARVVESAARRRRRRRGRAREAGTQASLLEPLPILPVEPRVREPEAPAVPSAAEAPEMEPVPVAARIPAAAGRPTRPSPFAAVPQDLRQEEVVPVAHTMPPEEAAEAEEAETVPEEEVTGKDLAEALVGAEESDGGGAPVPGPAPEGRRRRRRRRRGAGRAMEAPEPGGAPAPGPAPAGIEQPVSPAEPRELQAADAVGGARPLVKEAGGFRRRRRGQGMDPGGGLFSAAAGPVASPAPAPSGASAAPAARAEAARPEEKAAQPKAAVPPFAPKKSAAGVTIAPDLAAMLADGEPPAGEGAR